MNTQKIKILQLGKQYYPHIGGIENVMQQIAEGIQGEVESYVLASQARGKAQRKKINQVHVYYAKSWGIIASLPISWDLVCYLRKHRKDYDLIHLHMPFPLGDLACLLSGFKGKLVVHWHSDIVRQKKAMWFYRPLMNWTLKRADAITIATQGNIDGSPYVKPFEKKCIIIPFGLRKKWEEKSDKYWKQRKELTRESPEYSKIKLLFIGRLVYYKGCEVLINAMEIMKKKQKKMEEIQLSFVGTGILEEELKRRTINAGLEKSIHFLGRLSDDDLEKEIIQSDVLVFPSVANSEAFGLVQLEAMAYGKPVINTALPTGVPWVSLNGKTGLTVLPEDAKALAHAISWMKNHPKERMNMGINARERVKTEFSEEKMLRSLTTLYKDLCRKK